MRISISKSFRWSASAATLLAIATAAQASVVISDTFTATPTRPIGSGLSGSITEVGSKVWLAFDGGAPTPLLASSLDGGLAQATGSASGSTPYHSVVQLDTIPSTPEITLQSDVNPAAAPWAAIQFTYHAGSMWGGQLFFLLESSGNFALYRGAFDNGSAVHLAGGAAPNFQGNAMNAMKLTYDYTANAVTGWINGTKVADAIALGAWVPQINYAGITVVDTANPNPGAQFDNFQISIVDVPEPSVALLALGGVGAMLMNRRRA
jgi:hypothetical protein